MKYEVPSRYGYSAADKPPQSNNVTKIRLQPRDETVSLCMCNRSLSLHGAVSLELQRYMLTAVY